MDKELSQKEKHKLSCKRWADRNRDKVNENSYNWRKKNPEKSKKIRRQWYYRHRKERKKYNHIYRLNKRIEVLKHYSPELRCVRCGFDDIRALSIDHINGGGNKHRRKIGWSRLITWLKQNNYPKGYQVLCMNCQFIKREEKNEMEQQVI